MQIRIHAGCKRLLMAFAIAGLIVAPTGAATAGSKGGTASGGGAPLTITAPGQQLDETSKTPETFEYARSNYVWAYSSGPVYGTVDAESWNAAGVLHTQVGSFDLTRGLPTLPRELSVDDRLARASSQYFIVQVKPEAFTDGSFDDVKRMIAEQGGSIVGEMPVAAFVVRMTAGADSAIKGSPSIIALLPYPPAFKLSPEIGRIPLPNAAKALSSVYSLRLALFPGEKPEVVAASLAALGLKVTKSYDDTVFVDADRSTLAAIAAIDAVASVEEVLPIFLNSEETTNVVQTGRWNNGVAPYTDAGIDGTGQLLMIIDDGISLDAGDLSNTRTDAGFDGQSVGTDPTNGAVVSNHRKVQFYGTTVPFGGTGDLLGCDGATTSGVTHGHTVAAVALGNGTGTAGSPAYSSGAGWNAVDASGNFWKLDGVVPKARLIAYDGEITPLTGRCDDVTQIVGDSPLDPGNLYTAPSTGALADAYTRGARTINFSWGSVANTYDDNAKKIDTFLTDKSDAMVFVAAGNVGRDKDANRIPDPNTIGAPATAKNIICVGACRNADDLGNNDEPHTGRTGIDLPNTRWVNSSNGPATIASNRIAPLLMAPGTDAGSLGLASEFHCKSNRNDQLEAVSCDVVSGQVSTSYASGAAAGAGMLVRDYFARGFYPDGTDTNTSNNLDQVASISGYLDKAILVASAQWMSAPGSNLPYTAANSTLTRKFRGNREQGFGRIQLTNALPLQSYPGTVTGLIVGDGALLPSGGVNNTGMTLNLAPNTSETMTVNVCDTSQPLTAVIAWNDPTVFGSASDVIARDLDLELVGPSPNLRKYLGNFFTDDKDDIGGTTATEECTYNNLPWPPNQVGLANVDTGPWSLPVSASAGGSVSCTNPALHVDHQNNVEAIFLSPDSQLNGINDDPATTTIDESADNQVQQGQWQLTVKAPLSNSGSQRYSIVIAGGVCKGSAARIQKVLPLNQLGGTALACNDSAKITIDEVAATGDLSPTAAQVASRTKIEVLDSSNAVTDTENRVLADIESSTSSGGNFRFVFKKIALTDGTSPESGNGVLDVRDGNRIRVTYSDVDTAGNPDPNAKRIATATVGCHPQLAAGGVLFGQFGKDAFTLVDGGCERDARGFFTFGFPDRYMDEGELVSYIVAFQSAESSTDLVNVSISLKAVNADTNSPASCKMGSAPTPECPDPNRTNNTVNTNVTVLDSPKVYGLLPAGQTLTPSFTIQMGNSMGGTKQPVDMIIGVTAKSAGKGVEAQIAQREILNADEFSLFYSTDFPTGGSEPIGGFDVNNNEILEGATVDPNNFTNDYIFETRVYSSMAATNPSITHPWNFDTDDGGFVGGLNNTSRPAPAFTISQWGEDKNFNGKLDGFCEGVDTPPTVPCTQGVAISFGCGRCSGNITRECTVGVDADCQLPLPNDGVCVAHGTCNLTLGEDRDTANGNLDTGWGTAGGCGWQTKDPQRRCIDLPNQACTQNSDCNGAGGGICNPLATTGGVWHTGPIFAFNDNPATPDECLFSGGETPNQCRRYYANPLGDAVGDNNWWELLLTPELHKVNTASDSNGPIYQPSITEWAWNMLVDIPDTNTSVTLEFDTDTRKTAGAELFNDAAVLIAFRGRQGARSGGNGPITNGFNMFDRISHCVDTDGNGFVDHCGTVGGALCNTFKNSRDNECGGTDMTATRGLCSIPPAQKKCTGNPNLNCTTAVSQAAGDASCNQRCSLNDTRACQNPVISGSTQALCTTGTNEGTCQDNNAVLGLASQGEKCVPNPAACDTTNDICPGLGQGVCVASGGLNNREGRNNCFFEGLTNGATGVALSVEPYGLATPADDDAANGYCSRNDSLNGTDKGVSCTGPKDCDAAGSPYATVRGCSLLTTRVCEKNTDCNRCSTNLSKSCITNADCIPSTEGTCQTGASAYGVCNQTIYPSFCNKLDSNIDEYVQKNGPGRNYSIKTSNGPDMRFTTLEDFYGDTGENFRAALGFNNREPDSITSGVAAGYGVAVDDMVISWKETRLDVDTHTCSSAGGECATLETSSSVSYEGNSVVSMTVTDRYPWDTTNNKNNCTNDLVCSLATNKACAVDLDCNVQGQGLCIPHYGDTGHCSVQLTKACAVASECGHCTLAPSKSCLSNIDCRAVVEGTCDTSQTCVADAAFNDDKDCNNNGVDDVTVKLTSDAETAGEIAYLDRVGATSVFKGNFPYSTFYDSPGSLFVVQSGTALPIVIARYEDRNDGTGSRCKNALEPTQAGFITATTTVAASSGRITIASYSVKLVRGCVNNTAKKCISDQDCVDQGVGGICSALSGVPPSGPYGDDDNFADANEVNNLVVAFANKSGLDVDDLTATLGTNSSNIECITKSSIAIGSLKDQEVSDPATYVGGLGLGQFQFKVANINRSNVADTLQAKFTVTVRSNRFDALTRATDITLDLDINASGGTGSQASLYEDFENVTPASGSFGNFTLEYLDANKASLKLSNGFRCQYNDPLGLNSQSSTNADCFLGFTSDPTSGVNDWHIHDSSLTKFSGGMGRAFSGKQSLHLGIHKDSGKPEFDTYGLRHIMSIRSQTVFIGLQGATPLELNFAQQVSFVDNSAGVNVTAGEAVDRGVVEAKTIISGVNLPWVKLYPFANVYDLQGTDDFSNCMFDPTDDGNNEDSFFDALDPNRRLGPSSTCYPEFCFVHQGQTDYRKDFDVTDIGNASDGPGLQGCSAGPPNCLPANTTSVISNPGTWVRPRFSLVPLAGKAVQFRFLYSSIEVGGTVDMFGFFGRGNISADDGWYIDDIHIDGALTSPVTLTSDTSTIAAPLVCGSCSNVTPALTGPVSTDSPGQIVTLTAKDSAVDICRNGVLQYQFFAVGDAGDTLLRDWTDNSTFVDAPLVTTTYRVKVRCSSDTSCDTATNSATWTVTVNCPTASLGKPFGDTIHVDKASLAVAEPDAAVKITWTTPASVDAIMGDLSGTLIAPATGVLKPAPPVASSTFTGTIIQCLVNDSASTNVVPIGGGSETTLPAAGNSVYYLVRGVGTAYTTQAVKERAGQFCNQRPRDTQLAADTHACP